MIFKFSNWRDFVLCGFVFVAPFAASFLCIVSPCALIYSVFTFLPAVFFAVILWWFSPSVPLGFWDFSSLLLFTPWSLRCLAILLLWLHFSFRSWAFVIGTAGLSVRSSLSWLSEFIWRADFGIIDFLWRFMFFCLGLPLSFATVSSSLHPLRAILGRLQNLHSNLPILFFAKTSVWKRGESY